MGLLIKLKNGDTQLKSLKFGQDQPGGGSSNQPFIKKDIVDPPDPKNPAFYNDFILRGGIEAPISAAEDVARLTKYFFNFNNPSGYLFTAKQNILSRTGTKTESSKGIGYAGGGLNEGAYTPLSTLAEAGVGFLGIHLNKQGIDPTGLLPSLSLKKYQDTIARNQLILPNFRPDTNRLTNLSLLIPENRSANNFAFVKGYGLNVGNSVVSYAGGSDSVVGVGKTYIKFATDNAGVPLKTLTPKPEGYLTPNKTYFVSTGSVYKPGELVKNPDKYLDDELTNPTPLIPRQDLKDYLVGKRYKSKANDENWQLPISASLIYNSLSTQNIPIQQTQDNPNYLVLGYDSWEYNFFPSIYKPGTLTPIDNFKTYLTKNSTYQTKISPSDISYSSSISQKLKEFGRQLITFPQYNSIVGHYTGVDPTKQYLGFYSSFKTLKVDQGIRNRDEDKWKDLQSKPIEGYLANLNKNAGDYEEGEGIKTLNNPNRVGGRGISFDFRLVSRKKRGFVDYPTPYDYITTSGSDYNKNGKDGNTLDRIYYNSGDKRKSNPINSGKDIIPFRIAIVNPQSPSTIDPNNQLNFRAYIDDLSDSYGADWGSQTYMGRGEKLYKYNSFSRDISFGFTIVADSSDNLNIMYNQLNRLAASIAPTYTSAGYMAGNLHKVTIGNYLYEQWGIMSGFTYEIIEDSPWEITKGKQVPMYIKVSGIKFTPIHNFRPESYFNGANKYIYQDSTTKDS